MSAKLCLNVFLLDLNELKSVVLLIRELLVHVLINVTHHAGLWHLFEKILQCQQLCIASCRSPNR